MAGVRGLSVDGLAALGGAAGALVALGPAPPRLGPPRLDRDLVRRMRLLHHHRSPASSLRLRQVYGSRPSVAVPHRLGRHVEVGVEPGRDRLGRVGPGDGLAHVARATRRAPPARSRTARGASGGVDGRAPGRRSSGRPSTGRGRGSGGGGRPTGRPARDRGREGPDRSRPRSRTGRRGTRRTASRRRLRRGKVRRPPRESSRGDRRGSAASRLRSSRRSEARARGAP